MKRIIASLCLAASMVTHADERLEFQVFLDEKPIGYHRVAITGTDDERAVSVEAAFDVKFLFINAYSYRHTANEQWQGQCLQTLKTNTDDDGEEAFVRGQRSSDMFEVETDKGSETLNGCVRTFAYWDSTLLDAPKLLNTQTGDYEAITRVDLGSDQLLINGNTRSSQKIRLQLPDDQFIDLWYSPEGDWLALQSPLEGGRVLSYYRKGETS